MRRRPLLIVTAMAAARDPPSCSAHVDFATKSLGAPCSPLAGPQSCECYRQCHARPLSLDHNIRVPCFERAGPNTLSDFPDKDEPGVKYLDDWRVRLRYV